MKKKKKEEVKKVQLEALRKDVIDIRECFADTRYLQTDIVNSSWFSNDGSEDDYETIAATPEAILVRRKMLVENLLEKQQLWNRLNGLLTLIYEEQQK